MANIKIQVVNESTVLSDAQVRAAVPAFQTQIHRDFAPAYGIDADLSFVPLGTNPDPSSWMLVILDNSDQANALGYHDLSPTGMPLGKAFAGEDIRNGLQWSVTVSHELCLTGDTRIPLLDGAQPTIKELLDRDHFWVYSCKENGEVRPGRAHSARLTHKQARVLKVTLDNAESVNCTPDHRFLMRDGTYKEAHNLQVGDSLMPLNRRMALLDEQKRRVGMYAYEQVYVPARDDWIYTHRVVMPFCPQGYVRHHKDFDRFNNSPENLVLQKWEDHQKLHSEHIRFYAERNRGKSHNLSAETREKLRELGRARLIAYNRSQKHRQDMAVYYSREGVREAHGRRLQQYARSIENRERMKILVNTERMRETSRQIMTNYNKSQGHRQVAAELGRKMFLSWRKNPLMSAMLRKMSTVNMHRLNQDPHFVERRDKRIRLLSHVRWHEKRGTTNPNCSLCFPIRGSNHKVSNIEEWGNEEVYDISVDKYHNFAVSAGVFVHNCEMLADPDVNLTVFVQDANPTSGVLYAYEDCDACEADSLAYNIDGVKVSDFVYPAWFESFRAAGSTQFDFGNKITKPFQILPGGYIGAFNVTSGSGWQQLTATASGIKPVDLRRAGVRVDSRISLRSKPRKDWRRSVGRG